MPGGFHAPNMQSAWAAAPVRVQPRSPFFCSARFPRLGKRFTSASHILRHPSGACFLYRYKRTGSLPFFALLAGLPNYKRRFVLRCLIKTRENGFHRFPAMTRRRLLRAKPATSVQLRLRKFVKSYFREILERRQIPSLGLHRWGYSRSFLHRCISGKRPCRNTLCPSNRKESSFLLRSLCT